MYVSSCMSVCKESVCESKGWFSLSIIECGIWTYKSPTYFPFSSPLKTISVTWKEVISIKHRHTHTPTLPHIELGCISHEEIPTGRKSCSARFLFQILFQTIYNQILTGKYLAPLGLFLYIARCVFGVDMKMKVENPIKIFFE